MAVDEYARLDVNPPATESDESGSQMASLSFVNMPGLVGLMAESKKGLFEVYLDKDDNTHFYHNSLKVAGLPLVGNERTVTQLFEAFERHRGDMLAFLSLRDNRLWWKLKDAIEG